MALEIGSRLGHYDVTALIGEGGMGQVYQATDTKLNRQVALKILPEAFASDPDRLARFQREAQVLASLNHPGIAAIYGLEESDDTRALVLELVEGPTLAGRIAQGPIAVDEALPIAKQIAEALEAAHEAGVIHRDLKPANIKVRDDGTVKVLDFGLAKALDTMPEGDPSLSPTLTAAATQMGVILGTAAYMSPEQARGKPVDKRADIWAFGCVLYEMLTGERPFGAAEVAKTLARVIEREPDFEALPSGSPETVRRVLRRCLVKERRQRLPDIGAARLDIDELMAASSPELAARPGRERAGWAQVMPWSLAALVIGALAAGAAVWTAIPSASPLVTRFVVPAPSPTAGSADVLSPDGRTIAFATDSSAEGESRVHLRRMDALETVALPDTDGTAPYAFSPDGEWLLVTDGAALKRVPMAGGSALSIAEAPSGVRGADWGPDDSIVWGSPSGLWTTPVTGGDIEQLLALDDGEIGYLIPRVLPGGRGVLFHVRRGDAGPATQVAVYDFRTGQHRVLFSGSSPQFATSGHLVFWREGALWGVPFDPDDLRVMGEPRRVVEGVGASSVAEAYYFVGRDGSLAYRASESAERSLVWVNRNGEEELIVAMQPREYESPSLSPDGKRLVVSTGDPFGGGELYRYDIDTEVGELVPLPGNTLSPRWSPDGSRIAFGSIREGAPADVYVMAADGQGGERRLTDSPRLQIPSGWFPDGEHLLAGDVIGTNPNIVILNTQEDIPVLPLLDTEAFEQLGVVSPSGKQIAYVSNESGVAQGSFQVHVREFPNTSSSLPRLIGPGDAPLWGPNGEELFYRALGGEVVAVEVKTGDIFELGSSRSLFRDTYHSAFSTWDIAPDGRFLMIKPNAGDPGVIVVQNFDEELAGLFPDQ
jgi:serine/threonine-protein kinase